MPTRFIRPALAFTTPTRILLVDAHEMMCDALRMLLNKFPGIEVVGVCGDGATAFQMTEELRPNLVLMEVDLPDGSGLALTRRMRIAFPQVKILVLTGHPESYLISEAIDAGASGYLLKTNASNELLHAVRTIQAGRVYLTVTLPVIKSLSPAAC